MVLTLLTGKYISDDDSWKNPAMDVVISCLYDGSADEVKLIRPGTSMVDNYAFADATQRDNILSYLSSPEEGRKWKLWPYVIDESTTVGKKTFTDETVSKDSEENVFQSTRRTAKPKGLCKTNK